MSQDPHEKTPKLLIDAVENLPCAFLVLDVEGRIVISNREAQRIFGCTGEELLHRSFDSLLSYRGGDVSGQGDCNAALFAVQKSGAEVPVEFSRNPFNAGGETFFAISMFEAHSPRHVEELFKAAVEFAPSGMVIVDQSGTIVLANREAERLFGYSREELLGHSIELLVPARFREKHPEDRAAYSRNPSARLMGGGRDLFGLHKDGKEIPVEIGLNPIQTDEGFFVLSVIADISARKRSEEAMRKTAQELKRSNAELEQFAYIASHDLQEPLRMVIGFLQLLQQRYEAQLDEKGTSYINYAVNGATRMSALISDLLDYSRLQSRRRDEEKVDLNSTVDLAIANLQKSIEESKAEVVRDELPTIYGDPAQLSRLFQNLLGNAIKFRRKDVKPQIAVKSERENQHWIVSVRDNGIGIGPEYSDRIFMIFQRLHGQKEYPGTGIGLAVCKKIVEQHGGNIWVESTPGEGSAFFCTFPDRK